MSENRLDKTYSVRINNGKINFPPFCACCMAPTNQQQQISSCYTEKKGVTKTTTSISTDVPICEECCAHQRKFYILRNVLCMFSILCGIIVGIYMTLNRYDEGLIPIATWGTSIAMFFLLTFVVRLKELPSNHTARYECVTVTSPMLSLGKPMAFVIFTFTNYEYAKIFRNANIDIAGDIRENVKTNTAKSTNVYSVYRPTGMNCAFIIGVELVVMSIINYIL